MPILKYSYNKVESILILVAVIVICSIFYFQVLHSNENIGMTGMYIFLGFFSICCLGIVKTFRTKLLLFPEGIEYRKGFSSNMIYYQDIHSISKEMKENHSTDTSTSRSYYILYGNEREGLAKIPVGLIGHRQNQIHFIRHMMEYNENIILDEACSFIVKDMEGLNDFIDVAKNKVIKMGILVAIVVVGPLLLIPIVFYLLALIIDKF